MHTIGDVAGKRLKMWSNTPVITRMTFEEFVREQSDRLSDPLAALVALTDLELTTLPDEERDALLRLVREHAIRASLIASELRASTRVPEIQIDLRRLGANARAAA